MSLTGGYRGIKARAGKRDLDKLNFSFGRLVIFGGMIFWEGDMISGGVKIDEFAL